MNFALKSTALAGSAFALFAAAGAAHAAEYANVVSATPVTGSFAVPRQQCAEGQRVVPSQPSGGGALVGAIVGGVLGNTIGHGAGRGVATGIGAVTGAAIGNSAEMANNPGQVVPVRDCRTVSSYENRVVGYDVVYEYHGQRYTTRTATDPGPRLAIDVRPSNGAYNGGAYNSGNYDDGAARGGYGAVPPADGPTYDQAPPPAGYPVPPSAYYGPAPVYYPSPYYYGAPRPYYAPPVVSIGFSSGYGWRHGYRYWH